MASEGVPATESVLRQEPPQAREELKNKSLELKKRDSELQMDSQGLGVANRQAEDAKAEFDCVKNVFQSEKDGLWRELEQTLAEKEETEKQADEDVARLQKEVKVFKLMKYWDRYNDWVQSKPPRYPIDAGSLLADRGTVEVLVSHAPSMPDASATAMVI